MIWSSPVTPHSSILTAPCRTDAAVLAPVGSSTPVAKAPRWSPRSASASRKPPSLTRIPWLFFNSDMTACLPPFLTASHILTASDATASSRFQITKHACPRSARVGSLPRTILKAPNSSLMSPDRSNLGKKGLSPSKGPARQETIFKAFFSCRTPLLRTALPTLPFPKTPIRLTAASRKAAKAWGTFRTAQSMKPSANVTKRGSCFRNRPTLRITDPIDGTNDIISAVGSSPSSSSSSSPSLPLPLPLPLALADADCLLPGLPPLLHLFGARI